MAIADVEHDRLLDARQKLEGWTVVALEDASEDVFEGPDARVDQDDLRTPNRLDSERPRAARLYGTGPLSELGGAFVGTR